MGALYIAILSFGRDPIIYTTLDRQKATKMIIWFLLDVPSKTWPPRCQRKTTSRRRRRTASWRRTSERDSCRKSWSRCCRQESEPRTSSKSRRIPSKRRYGCYQSPQSKEDTICHIPL